MKTSQKRLPGPTFDSYSRSGKFTSPYFYYPTRNPHNQTNYQSKFGAQQSKTFRNKAKTIYSSHMHESQFNPLVHNHSHYQKAPNIAGDRKKVVEAFSARITDPITLKYQPGILNKQRTKTFEPSDDYKKEVERRDYLPADRELAKSRVYHQKQLGFSPTIWEKKIEKVGLNKSMEMKTIIQYVDNPEANRISIFDDFKYDSRK